MCKHETETRCAVYYGELPLCTLNFDRPDKGSSSHDGKAMTAARGHELAGGSLHAGDHASRRWCARRRARRRQPPRKRPRGNDRNDRGFTAASRTLGLSRGLARLNRRPQSQHRKRKGDRELGESRLGRWIHAKPIGSQAAQRSDIDNTGFL